MVQDFFTEFENTHFWPYTVPPKLACIVINRKMYRISHIEEKKGWKLFFKSDISNFADPIELKLGNYLHLMCILGPMKDFMKILTFFHFSGLCSNFCVFFLKKNSYTWMPWNFQGGKYSDSLISGDNNTPWASLSDRSKQFLEGNTFSYIFKQTFRSRRTYILGAENQKISKKMVFMEFFGSPFLVMVFPWKEKV